jgi:hypothetical protein
MQGFATIVAVVVVAVERRTPASAIADQST